MRPNPRGNELSVATPFVPKVGSGAAVLRNLATTGTSIIEKTPDVCFGRARIRNTRIPVWILVRYRKLGATDERLIEYYPHLTVTDLQAAWDYYEHNANEIERAAELC